MHLSLLYYQFILHCQLKCSRKYLNQLHRVHVKLQLQPISLRHQLPQMVFIMSQILDFLKLKYIILNLVWILWLLLQFHKLLQNSVLVELEELDLVNVIVYIQSMPIIMKCYLHQFLKYSVQIYQTLSYCLRLWAYMIY